MRSPKKYMVRTDYGAHAPDLDEIWRQNPSIFKCPYCGQQLYPYKDSQSYGIVRCYTSGCPNNPDDGLARAARDLEKLGFYNRTRINRRPHVRRLL